jgi:cobalamin-dependent methionine synthase I
VNLVSFVELKLAAGRLQDFADVVALIRARNLDEAFAERLHPAVRKDYREYVDEAREEQRREEEYFAQE